MSRLGFVEIPDEDSRAHTVQRRVEAADASAAQGGGSSFDWKQMGLMAGGGLLAHSLASSLLNNKTDEEKRRESTWERLLAAILPLGAAGLGAWGGHYLHSKMAAAGYVMDGQTNRLDRISADLSLARDTLNKAVEAAGGDVEELPLGPRVSLVTRKDLIPEAEKRQQNAYDRSLGTGIGAAGTGIGTAWAGKKWWDYAKQEANAAEAHKVLAEQEAAQRAMADYQQNAAQYNEQIATKERELAIQRARAEKAENVQMRRPTPEAARVLTEANAQAAALQQAIATMRQKAPTPPSVKSPDAITLQRARAIALQNPTLVKPKVTPRRVAKAGTLAGAGLTLGLTGASIWNNHVANEQAARAAALQNLVDILRALKKSGE